ncbi:hypothetical protein MJT46_014373 [Ovis ammon polii x Ovis aries]|nr:hypothetical protein MJT46_014373 [Ovis ammon polii x Ovis aries]
MWGTLGMVVRLWSSSRLSCGELLLLRCDGNARNSFPTKQGKDPSSRASRRKLGSPGCVRDPRASSRVETAQNLLDFLELRQVLSTYDWDLRDPLWWPQKRPVPMRVPRGHSGFLSRRCRSLRPCVESGPEPEDSSPVLTWIWGISGVSPGESVLVSNAGMHLRFPPER